MQRGNKFSRDIYFTADKAQNTFWVHQRLCYWHKIRQSSFTYVHRLEQVVLVSLESVLFDLELL